MLFLPFIERLKQECKVHDMASRTDYRKLAHYASGVFFEGDNGDDSVEQAFAMVTGGVEPTLEVQ